MFRRTLGASNAERLVGFGVVFSNGMVLDATAGKIYRTEWQNGRIRRANLDGSVLQVVGSGGHAGITLDLPRHKMYWTDKVAGEIRRADLSGAGVETVVESSSPLYVAVDSASERLYWSDPGAGAILRANLEGSDMEPIAGGVVWGLALDLRVMGDCDGDRALTLSDHADVSTCLTGPNRRFTEGCSCADINGDGSVDLRDAAAFQTRL